MRLTQEARVRLQHLCLTMQQAIAQKIQDVLTDDEPTSSMTIAVMAPAEKLYDRGLVGMHGKVTLTLTFHKPEVKVLVAEAKDLPPPREEKE